MSGRVISAQGHNTNSYTYWSMPCYVCLCWLSGGARLGAGREQAKSWSQFGAQS
jgi:hypothetical protein